MEVIFKESFYSVSRKSVLRGMHFQLPPNDHAKLVYVVSGEILDVAVDLRRESRTYGEHVTKLLNAESAQSLYMEKGMAHGFMVMSDMATVVYLTSTVHAPESDQGIHWDSFGCDWGQDKPIVSERDSSFSPLHDFTT